jgi:hypothetical protein
MKASYGGRIRIKKLDDVSCSNMDETKHGWKHHTVEELKKLKI